MPLTFRIQDRQNENLVEELTKVLRAACLDEASTGGRVNLLIVHRNTDAPGQRGGVALEEALSAKKDGVFVEYTGGGTVWSLEAKNHVYCDYHSLHERLGHLAVPVDTEQLRSTLLAAKASGLEVLSSFAILSQGYLAVHAVYDEPSGTWGPPDVATALRQMSWPQAMADDGILSALRPHLHEYRQTVAEPEWWLQVFGFSGGLAAQTTALRQQVEKEWKESGGDSEAELPPSIAKLLDAIGREGTRLEAALVADAYCAMVERLGGQPCKA